MFGGTGFGAPTTTSSTGTGFSFGQTSTPATGFNLGGGAPATSGGFSFGGTATAGTAAVGTATGATPAPAAGGFSFGTPAASTTGTTGGGAGGFSFGTAPQATTTPAPTGFNLGQTTGAPALNFGATTATAAPASSAGFSFAAPASAQKTTAPTGFNLGGTVTSQATPAGFSLGGATSSASSGFTLGGTPTATTSATPATSNTLMSGLLSMPKTPAAATGFSLGGSSTAAVKPAGLAGFSLPTATATTTTTTSAGVNFGFGATAATTTAAVPGFTLGTSTATTTSSSLAPAVKTTAGGQMNYRQLEDQINKWMTELEDQERLFLQQATQVNAWDRLLVDNGEKITTLNDDMERVKVDQNKLEQELEFIKSQERELEDLLVPLEKSLDQATGFSLQPHADLERENTYQLADNIDAQLKRMVQDLKEIIDHLNTSQSSQDTNDPVLQITKILNAHMDSLHWVDTNTAVLGRRVEEISKQMESQRKDQERNFRLVYD